MFGTTITRHGAAVQTGDFRLGTGTSERLRLVVVGWSLSAVHTAGFRPFLGRGLGDPVLENDDQRMTGSLDTRDNGLTAARLMLALTVVVSHSFTLTGGQAEPLVAETGQVSLGILAVLGFFVCPATW